MRALRENVSFKCETMSVLRENFKKTLLIRCISPSRFRLGLFSFLSKSEFQDSDIPLGFIFFYQIRLIYMGVFVYAKLSIQLKECEIYALAIYANEKISHSKHTIFLFRDFFQMNLL